MRTTKGRAARRSNKGTTIKFYRDSSGEFTKRSHKVDDFQMWRLENKVREIRRFRFWWGLIIGFLLGSML